MIHIFTFIYSSRFYFDLIGYIEFQLLIIFYSNFLRLQFEILYYIYSFIRLSNLSPYCFSYSSFQGEVFSSPRTMVLLHRLRLWSSFLLFLLVSTLPTSETNCSDRCFNRKLLPEPSYFHHTLSGGGAVYRIALILLEVAPY